jgi:hypothetical protein
VIEEEIPVFGGRLLVAVGILFATVLIPMSSLGNLIEKKEPTAPSTGPWRTGETATIAVTVITADYNLLSCASEKEIDGFHCQYKGERDMWPRAPGAPLDDNKATIIQPYRTWLENRLILMPGLWAQPEVAMRLHREPPQGVSKDKLARFVAECKVEFIGELPDVRLRWDTGAAWTGTDGAPPIVAKPLSCKISNASEE